MHAVLMAPLYTQDNGNTWHRIKGFNFKWTNKVSLDERDPEKIYILTFGGGVWHGPAKGDEQAIEDIIIPVNNSVSKLIK